jgi:two-component system sensor kinase FixL
LYELLAALTAILGARRAYVTENFDPGMSRTVASWEDGEPGPVREYALSGTPCAAVMRHGVQVVDCELGRRYMLDKASIGYGCESFVGSPIVNREGEKIGQICVFGAQPLHDPEMASAIVSLAAVRVSAELEHRQEQAAVARSEACFRAVFDQRLHLAGILSVEGRVLEANQKSLDFAGLQREQVIGHCYWDTPWWSHSPETQKRMHDAIRSAAAGETVRFETTCPRSDGQVATLDFSVRPIKDKDGKIIFLVTESDDITERRHAEEEARQHRARVAHVARLSTLGEMAAGIAHEINQPLTAISLFAQAGRRMVDSGNFERMGEVCHKLNEHALRASEVVERMQTMARQGENEKRVVDCNELIDSAVKLAESEARIYDIQIAFDRGDNLAPVSVDGVQIQQVALNLLRNGMEAMTVDSDAGGRSISIRTRMRDRDEIEISVSDTGCGIPDEYSDKLFTPFSTTKTSGMGMGLSISQAIVRAHGGGIGFYNNDSGGATFWFTLPAAE